MTFAQEERAALCDRFEEVGPEAPTLCSGWTTHDLATHLWIRENDPVGATGIVAKPLAGLLERRMAEVKQRWPYSDLVERIRNGPRRLSVFAIPGVDEGANTTEYFVHHEDVRRAGAEPLGPRDLAAEVEEWMWRRLKLLARAWFRRSGVGLVLERSDAKDGERSDAKDGERSDAKDGEPGDQAEVPASIRAVAGTPIVTLVGRPSELMLFAHGRGGVAEVEQVGEPSAIESLNTTNLEV